MTTRGVHHGARELSLAAGVALDVPPEQMPAVAQRAGFDAVGVWFDGETWTPATTVAVRRALDAEGQVALDIEPIILRSGPDHGERLIEAGIEIGARFALVATGNAERSAVVDRLGALAELVAGSSLRLVVEFLPIFSVATLGDAVSVVAEVGSPDVGVLVDTLHLDRSGGSADELAAVDSRLLPYVQVADAGPDRPTDWDGLRDEAVHGRLLPGSGVLPLAEMIAAVPEVPLSVELRSRDLMERHPDPVERATVVRASMEPLI